MFFFLGYRSFKNLYVICLSVPRCSTFFLNHMYLYMFLFTHFNLYGPHSNIQNITHKVNSILILRLDPLIILE